MNSVRQAGVVGEPPVSRVKRARHAPTKLGAIIDTLRGAEGASIADMVAITDWKVRTIRGVLAGTLKHRHQLIITSIVVEGVRVYRAEAVNPTARSSALRQ